MIRRFVVFGASGSLGARYLLPALAQLHAADALPHDFEVVGVARQRWSDAQFREHAAEALGRRALEVPPSLREDFVSRLRYRHVDLGAPAPVVVSRLDLGSEPLVAYLALPPGLFPPAVRALGEMALAKGSRIVIEKPFGESLASALALNRLLHERFPEEAIFRIDHFLGKQTVQNVLGLRFANRVFEPLWNCHHVERVDIVWDEVKTPHGRIGYYDRAGAVRDMVQNHLLQLLTLVAMEVPRTLDARDLRERKVDVLRAIRRLSPAEVARFTRRGRYGRGRVAGRSVRGYVEEPGVEPDRQTETFTELTLWVDNWRWADVPFVLRTGKALARHLREIRLRFKRVPHLAFGRVSEPAPNVLRLALDPDRVSLAVNINGPGDPFDLEQVELETTLAPQTFSPYARLLLDVLRGDHALSIGDDEAEESWAIVEPILAAWQTGRVALEEYPAGSAGPRVRSADPDQVPSPPRAGASLSRGVPSS
jgi:glucose-6-phosphate 1-dehydrogenase